MTNIVLGAGAQSAAGSTGADSMDGGGGADSLSGLGGADTLQGGTNDNSSDTLSGGLGNDFYFVTGSDQVIEAAGGGTADLVFTLQTYTLPGEVERLLMGNVNNLPGAGNNINGTGNGLANVLTGNLGNNRLDGLAGADSLNGGAGDDTLNGGTQNDVLTGDSGNDLIDAGNGQDTVLAGLGNDVIRLTSGNAFGDSGNDFIATSGNAFVNGGDGADTINSGLGNDQIDGGLGNDLIDPGTGADTVSDFGGDDIYRFGFGYGSDVITERGTGNDTLKFRPGVSRLNVSFSREGTSLRVRLRDNAGNLTGDTLLIVRHFDQLAVEHFQLDDGSAVPVFIPPAAARLGSPTATGADSLLGLQARALVQQMAAFGGAGAGDTAPAPEPLLTAPNLAAGIA